jgi:hypothetical protein
MWERLAERIAPRQADLLAPAVETPIELAPEESPLPPEQPEQAEAPSTAAQAWQPARAGWRPRHTR